MKFNKKIKAILIIAALIIVMILPVCYGLIRGGYFSRADAAKEAPAVDSTGK